MNGQVLLKQNKVSELSVFFPLYNEEENVIHTVESAQQVLKSASLKQYEIILINDGSKDATPQIIEKLRKEDSHIRIITHNPNKGYGEALKSGFYNAKFAWIVFTDADGQIDFSELPKLLDKSDQADLVVGFRINRQDSMIRRLNGVAWTFLNNLLFGLKVKDVDCPFKLIRKEVIETIPKLESTRGGMISPELLAKAKKNGFRIIEVGVHHYSRKKGQSTGANLKVIFKSFVDLFKLWWKIH